MNGKIPEVEIPVDALLRLRFERSSRNICNRSVGHDEIQRFSDKNLVANRPEGAAVLQFLHHFLEGEIILLRELRHAVDQIFLGDANTLLVGDAAEDES